MDIQQWARKFTKDAYRKNVSFGWHRGFTTFFTPVKERPALLILSMQPGGSERDYQEAKKRHEAGDFNPPNDYSYFEKDFQFAKQLRIFLDYKRNKKRVRDSVAMPIIFFRASGIQLWRQEATQIIDMELYSFRKVAEAIETLQPKAIIVIGLQTFEWLQRNVFKKSAELIGHEEIGPRKDKLIKAKFKGMRIAVFRHISKRRPIADKTLKDAGKKALQYAWNG